MYCTTKQYITRQEMKCNAMQWKNGRTVSTRECSKFATQLRSVGGRCHAAYERSLFGVGKVDIQHTDRRLIALKLGRFGKEHSRANRLLCDVPHSNVHVTAILAERSETHVQWFFRLVDVAATNHRRFVGVNGRFDDCDKVTGNVNVLPLTIHYLQTVTETRQTYAVISSNGNKCCPMMARRRLWNTTAGD